MLWKTNRKTENNKCVAEKGWGYIRSIHHNSEEKIHHCFVLNLMSLLSLVLCSQSRSLFLADLPHNVWWTHTAQCWAQETMMSMSSWQLCRVEGSLQFGGTNASECDFVNHELRDDHKRCINISPFLSHTVGQYRICAWTKFKASFWMSHQGCHWDSCLFHWDADTGWQYGRSTNSSIT